MDDSKTLLWPSKFPWAREKDASECTASFGRRQPALR